MKKLSKTAIKYYLGYIPYSEMIIQGQKLAIPPKESCPEDPAEKQAWLYFKNQVFNCLMIVMDYCQSKFVFQNKR